MIRHRFTHRLVIGVVSLALSIALVVSCGPREQPPTATPVPAVTPTEAPEPVVAPTEEPEPTVAPIEESIPEVTEAPVPTPAVQPAPGRVDIDAIFPPGRGRELALMGCTGCHNWVPLVILGFNEEEWDRNARHHRDFVSAMSDEDFKILYDYLKENFGPDTPVPELPQELLDAWTSY